MNIPSKLIINRKYAEEALTKIIIDYICTAEFKMKRKKYRIGVVLSGGGARGFAHLGVMQALNDAGIFPDIISGTSAGALVGVLYADGYTPEEILQIMNSSSMLHYVRPTIPREGLLQISGIEGILKDYLKASRFEELAIPLYVTATDLNNGQATYFSKGELIKPVIASASIPVLFKPVIIDDIYYVDGGVMDNLPVSPIENKCSFIIGSSVNPTGYEKTVTSMVQIAERSFRLIFKYYLVYFAVLQIDRDITTHRLIHPDKIVAVFHIV